MNGVNKTKLYMMNNNTFGDPTKYRMLIYLTEKISQQDKHKKAKYSSYIEDFNRYCKKIEQIPDMQFRRFVLGLYRKELLRKTYSMYHDTKIISYMKNYFKAKLNDIC